MNHQIFPNEESIRATIGHTLVLQDMDTVKVDAIKDDEIDYYKPEMAIPGYYTVTVIDDEGCEIHVNFLAGPVTDQKEYMEEDCDVVSVIWNWDKLPLGKPTNNTKPSVSEDTEAEPVEDPPLVNLFINIGNQDFEYEEAEEIYEQLKVYFE